MCDRMHDSIVSIIDSITFLEQCPRLEPFSSGPGRARHRTWRFGRVVCSNGRAPVPDASAVPPPSRHEISTATAQAHVGTGFARRTARGALTYRAPCRVIGVGSPPPTSVVNAPGAFVTSLVGYK